jgi:hypothetical protein
LAADLAKFSPGVTFLVLTDDPLVFRDVPSVQAVYHRKRSVLGYNDKLAVIKKALDQYSTAVFVDADVRILAPVHLSPEVFKPGLRTFLIRTWAWMRETSDTSPEGPEWQKNDLRMMAILVKEFSLPNDGSDIPYVVEFLFAITKGGRLDVEAYLRKWNQLAEFCERRRLFIHLGLSMGLAARLTGFPVEQHDFRGVKFFEPLISGRDQVPNKELTPEEYEALNATITRYKYSRGRTTFASRAVEALKKRARYLRIKLFGLDLINC